jgi:PAS domain S-box-containing protein
MGMWERDLATDHITWSDAMYKIFGRSPEEFSGRPDEVLSYVHPEDRQNFREIYQAAIGGKSITFEHESRIIRRDGEVRWIYRRAFIRRDRTGRAHSVLGVALDITERKQAEDANAQFAAIVSSSSEAILSVSRDGLIATWNAGAEQTFGYGSSEAVGKSLLTLFSSRRSKDFEAIWTALHSGETIRLESECLARDGQPIEVQIVANPVRGGNAIGGSGHAVSRYSIIMRNISERKEHDRHLATVMRELTHRSKNLLAIIQAMARQTAIRSTSLSDFEARFSGRLQSLARSHELLISNDWEGAALGDLVDVQRSTFGPCQLRIRSSGPKVFLRPEAILNIGLALHELASNAERHGALCLPEGQVNLTWSLESHPSAPEFLRVVWKEQSAASSHAGLSQRGFGRDIIEHVAPTALGAKVELKSLPEGFEWALEVPSDQFARDRRNAA